MKMRIDIGNPPEGFGAGTLKDATQGNMWSILVGKGDRPNGGEVTVLSHNSMDIEVVICGCHHERFLTVPPDAHSEADRVAFGLILEQASERDAEELLRVIYECGQVRGMETVSKVAQSESVHRRLEILERQGNRARARRTIPVPWGLDL